MNETTYETEIRAVPQLEDASTLHVRGTIRYAQAPGFRQAILEWVTSSPASRLIIELDEVREIDTSGAAVLVEALLFGRDRSKQMLLCSPSESVMKRLSTSWPRPGRCGGWPSRPRAASS
jgi:anti-anti-sigma factor